MIHPRHTIGSLRELKQALKEVPDHYLDTPLQIWVDDHCIIDQHPHHQSDRVCELTKDASPSLVFTNADLISTMMYIIDQTPELLEYATKGTNNEQCKHRKE